jgi:hypothetical protein
MNTGNIEIPYTFTNSIFQDYYQNQDYSDGYTVKVQTLIDHFLIYDVEVDNCQLLTPEQKEFIVNQVKEQCLKDFTFTFINECY